jgi:hypothetical protein
MAAFASCGDFATPVSWIHKVDEAGYASELAIEQRHCQVLRHRGAHFKLNLAFSSTLGMAKRAG